MTFVMAGASAITTALLLILRRDKYEMSWIKIILLFLVIGVIGCFGAMFASYVSYGYWSGIRFYGKALFVTIALYLLAKMMKVDYFKLMDYYAPIDIFALVIMKANCMRAGCCAGIMIYTSNNNVGVVFPSQQVEFIVAAIIFFTIIVLENRGLCNGYRYALYIIMYGLTRFVFDFLREDPGEMICIFGVLVSITQIFCAILMSLGITLVAIQIKQPNGFMRKEHSAEGGNT